MMSRLTFLTTASILMTCFLCVTAEPAHAYLNPYDVLLSQDLILPATSRESFARVDRQQRESAARREREQEAIFAEQHPVAAEEVFAAGDEDFFAAAPEFAASGDDLIDREFLSLMRTLERVKKQQNESQLRQQALSLLAAEGLHSGAPLGQFGGYLPTGSKGLAPTGAGTFLAIGVLFFAIWWTMRKSKKEEVVSGL